MGTAAPASASTGIATYARLSTTSETPTSAVSPPASGSTTTRPTTGGRGPATSRHTVVYGPFTPHLSISIKTAPGLAGATTDPPTATFTLRQHPMPAGVPILGRLNLIRGSLGLTASKALISL